jgi:hypothetical protein
MHAERDAIIHKYAQRLAGLKKGQKGAIIAEACAELGCGRMAFYRLLGEIMPSGRKTREGKGGAGDTALTRHEADLISAYLMEGYNHIDKKGRTLKEAVRVLRSNGKITAGRVDVESGEVSLMSLDAISKALRYYEKHPDQLRRPTPHTNLASKHPNHVHQVDTSVGTIYYLKDGTSIVEWDKGEHYKNKPWNIETAQQHRVIRYVLTDHCTGVVRFRYYPHSENARWTVDFLAWCWAQKDDPADPFHGASTILYVDLGIANTLVRRFCERLGVNLIAHKPKNSRATGSVEGSHNYAVELPFEHGLRDLRQDITSFEALNRAAYRWQLWWNATEVHGRHKMTRFQAWMFIKPEELRQTAPYQTLLSLATERPKKCQVRGDLTAKFKGRIWDVKTVPGVMVKGDVFLHWHPFIADTAMAVIEEDGKERHIALTDVTGVVDPAQGQWGFIQGAAVLGEEFKAKPDTRIDTNRKHVRLIASGAETLQEDEKRRKRKDFVAFGASIDPLKEAREADLPAYIKKRGTAIDTPALTIETPPLGHRAAARRLIELLGDAWRPEYMQEIQTRYPAGVPEADLEALAAEFRERGETPAKRPPLKAVK